MTIAVSQLYKRCNSDQLKVDSLQQIISYKIWWCNGNILYYSGI